MNGCEMFNLLLSKVDHSKSNFCEWIEFMGFQHESEELYEIIISWTDDAVLNFVEYWDFDFDRIESQIYEFEDEYLENGGKLYIDKN